LKKDTNLKPITEFKVSRRNLPHWEFPGSTYFVTFKTSNNIFLDDKAKDIVLAAIKFHAGKKFTLRTCIVMSNHVHLIITPLEISKDNFYSLGQIMHTIKSYSANRIQSDGGLKNNIWLDEKYDRIIRNHDELMEEMSYIINNPVKDGIVKKPEDHKWLYLENPG
jgi:putative transposase